MIAAQEQQLRPVEGGFVARIAEATRKASAAEPAAPDAGAWEGLQQLSLDVRALAARGLVTWEDRHPAAGAFRAAARTVQGRMAETGSTRLAVIAVNRAAGATTLAANMAICLSRAPEQRLMLLDLDFQRPGLRTVFGLDPRRAGHWPAADGQGAAAGFRRLGRSIAVGFLDDPGGRDRRQIAAEALRPGLLDGAIAALRPDLLIIDAPPILEGGAAGPALGLADAAILVAGEGRTRPREVRLARELVENELPLLGVLLARSENVPGAL